jgi:hypothetical protein
MARTPLGVGTSVFSAGKRVPVGVTPMPIAPHVPRDDDEDRKAPDIGDVVERIINGGDGPSPVAAPA